MALNPRITDWSGQVVWLLGASTGIGRATAALLHSRGAQVVVSARHAKSLLGFETERPGSLGLPLDATDAGAVAAACETIVSRFGRIDVAMYCAGTYKPMRATHFDLAETLAHQRVNYEGALHLLDAVLPQLSAQRHGHVSLVASVAGYRGLPHSMAYGPTKAALQHLAETLYLDLHPAGIGVSVVNPGFVATPLTAGNAFNMPALLTPEQAAGHIMRGWARGRFEIHFPKRFTLWLKLLRLLPPGLYFSAVRRATRI
jgi:NAD(P)-dependent dehydrogenase (short-subunit alcohol dehydrogenase family)